MLLAVWGVISYQVYITISSDEDEISESNSNERFTSKDPRLYEYKANVRDPFQLVPVVAAPKKIVRDTVKKTETIWVPPPYRLSGVVVNSQKRVAILEGTDGGVYFASEGDSVGNVKILKIENKKVSYFYLKKTLEWKVE